MAVKTVSLKNTAPGVIGSWAFAVPLSRVAVSIASGLECSVELKVNGERFSGKGPSVVVALQDLTTSITTAAVKQQRRGRAPERVRVAATLLRGEPN